MIRKTHRDKSTSLLRREPAIPHFEVDTFYFSDLIFTTLFYPLGISLKLEKQVWVKMSFAYDNDVHSLLSIS